MPKDPNSVVKLCDRMEKLTQDVLDIGFVARAIVAVMDLKGTQVDNVPVKYLHLLPDLLLLAKRFSVARENLTELPWISERYNAAMSENYQGTDPALEAELATKFPGLSPPRETAEPVTISDIDGQILVCSLPNVFTPATMKAAIDAVAILNESGVLKYNENAKTMRQSPSNFTSGPALYGRGTLAMSVAWFAAGHEFDRNADVTITPGLLKDGPLTRYLDTVKPVLLMISAMTALVFPSLWTQSARKLAAGQHSMMYGLASKPSHLAKALSKWFSPYHCTQVIVNRQTPVHRDPFGGPYCLDLLLTFGDYPFDTQLEMPSLNLKVPYGPGSAVFINSRLVSHKVPEVQGERICIANFLRHRVLKHLRWFPFPATWPAMANICADVYCSRYKETVEENLPRPRISVPLPPRIHPVT